MTRLTNPSDHVVQVKHGCALRMVWFAIALFVGSIVIGLAWDRAWHVTQAFDTFFSPPHLFTYSMIFVTSALSAYMAYSPALRSAFGPGVRLPALPVAIPGALILLGSGFVMLALAGLLDSVWHTSFGLDETGWSTPHALIGWGLLVVMLGFIACRLALRTYRPLSSFSLVLLGLLLLSFSIGPIVGAIWTQRTPEFTQAIASMPVLAAQPEVQHRYRIFLAWNLNRTNPLLALLGGLWAGMAIAVLRGLDPHHRIWLTVIFVWSFFSLLGDRSAARRLGQAFQLDLAGDPAAWLPLPILSAAVVMSLLLRFRLRERWAWLIAGAVFGLCVARFWVPSSPPGLLVVVSALTVLGGARLGAHAYAILEHADRRGLGLIILTGFCVPILTGIVDLYLRNVTP